MNCTVNTAIMYNIMCVCVCVCVCSMTAPLCSEGRKTTEIDSSLQVTGERGEVREKEGGG